MYALTAACSLEPPGGRCAAQTRVRTVDHNFDRLVIDAHERSLERQHHNNNVSHMTSHHVAKTSAPLTNHLTVPLNCDTTTVGNGASSHANAPPTTNGPVAKPTTATAKSWQTPAKLNMTLDLSVATLKNVHRKSWRLKHILGKTTTGDVTSRADESDVVSVTSNGIAATSGVVSGLLFRSVT